MILIKLHCEEFDEALLAKLVALAAANDGQLLYFRFVKGDDRELEFTFSEENDGNEFMEEVRELGRGIEFVESGD